MVYQNLMGQEKNIPVRNHEAKWEKILEMNIEEKNWKKIYGVNFESCVELSLRAFQYSILLRTVPTNKYLVRCNLVNTDKCSFCQINTESIEHLFFYCPIVRNFIFAIVDKIDAPPDIKKGIDASDFLLGNVSGSLHNSMNYLYTLIKKFVFVTKINGNNLCLKRFAKMMKHYYELENTVVLNNFGNLNKHMIKWDVLKPVFLIFD